MTPTTPINSNSDNTKEVLASVHNALVEAMRAIENLQISHGEIPTTLRSQAVDFRTKSPGDTLSAVDRPKAIDLCFPPVTNPPATPPITTTPIVDRDRSAKRKKVGDFENEPGQELPTATPLASTTSPIETIRSAKKVMTSRPAHDAKPPTTPPMTTISSTDKIRSNEKASMTGLARALKTLSGNWTQSHTNDLSKTADLGLESDPSETVLLEVKATPYSRRVESVGDDSVWIKSPTGMLKLYKHTKTGVTRIVQRNDAGQVKLNVRVGGNGLIDLEKVLHPKKIGRRQLGSVAFTAYENSKVGIERFSLKVNADDLDILYEKLIEMGAKVKG